MPARTTSASSARTECCYVSSGARDRDQASSPTVPFFDDLHVDRESSLWAREYSAPNPVAWWQIASVTDGVIARVALPWGAEVLDAGLDHVVTLERDELGVELVRVYRLER
ncbi:MAG: hypothetical protein R3E10_15540 [Gemmatimonadota bacterium]